MENDNYENVALENEEYKKDEIHRNYLPNLSEYQQISYYTNNVEEGDVLYPNVNYQDESKKSFYIFYNNNLSGLKNLYTKELKRLKDNYPFVLYHIMDFLDQLDLKLDVDSFYNPFKLISKLISYNYEPIINKARTIAKNLIKIENIEKSYGTDIKIRAFEIKVNNDKEGIFNELSFDEKSNYPAIETNFRNLGNVYNDNLSYINELDKLLNYYLKEFNENIADISIKNRFCFILNRASFYLSNKEKLREQYKLNVLNKLDKLRRKIDYLLLKHRFKFEQNKRPILNINIERCIILINTLETTSIYIEKTELRKFIEKLEFALEHKLENQIQFINIFKLHKQLIGRNYHIRNDFLGIILSEGRAIVPFNLNKNMRFEEQVYLREYEIKEIYNEV